ncbi:hypothetical protein LCGC14_1111460 [marine sediment metagenome]|uniref:Uncharacterized protein n=1 Tax=marine sediment metagenome TaxID=412755 RepID=A0A0F9M6H9_9ZZZZ
MSDYSDNFNVNSNQLRESYIYIVSEYPYLKEIFLNIVNTIINNNFNPCGIVLLSAYYLMKIEENGINIINYIGELRKHKCDSDYLLSSLSVLRVSFYLTERKINFEFPTRKKYQNNPDIIVHINDGEFKIDVKGRGAAQLKKLAYQFANVFKNPGRPSEWHSFDEGIQDELEKSELRRIVENAFTEQKVDMLVIDETNNLFQIGSIFMISEMQGSIKEIDTFSFNKNNLIFCSFFGGNFKCIEINKDVFLDGTKGKQCSQNI